MSAVFSPIKALKVLGDRQPKRVPSIKKVAAVRKVAASTKGSKKVAAIVPIVKKSVVASTIKKFIAVDSKPLTAKPIIGDKYVGDGTPLAPLKQILRVDPNRSGCTYCSANTCPCNTFTEILSETFRMLARKRITSTNKKQMCAKSILPTFVSRLVDVLKITKDDVFYDLGCGNGSVLFQIAFMTGAKCIGVELSEHNAQLAREAWAIVRPQLEKIAGKQMPEVEIITGDLTAVIAEPRFLSKNTAVWTANLLMPKMLTQHMAERFRQLPVGSRIACFDDMFPHSRSIARIRDPEAFELFEMVDHTWAPSSVEWTFYEGPFYSYTRK